MKNNIVAIIPAAGRGSRMLSLTQDMPKAMLPLHNKPVIGWILDHLIQEKIKYVDIVIGYKGEKLVEYVDEFYSDKINVTYTQQDQLSGLAYAIHLSVNNIKKNYGEDKEILIVLGDTIIKDNIQNKIKRDFIGYKEVDEYKRWCLVDIGNNKAKGFIHQSDVDYGIRTATIGVYFFKDFRLFDKCIDKIIDDNIRIKNEFQISSVMEEYMKVKDIYCERFEDWFDCGEIKTFNDTRKHVARQFNSITITADNTVIKRSTNFDKIRQEIYWYLNIPNKLKVYTPQLINYSEVDPFYELEHINFTPMNELFLFNLPSIEEWKIFFDTVFNFIDKLRNYSYKNITHYNSDKMLKEILLDKTVDRIKYLDGEYWKDIKEKDYININKITYKNIPLLQDKILQYIETFILPDSLKFWQIIHGDLFFGNMFYDVNSNTMKVIDPRGNFGIDTIYGDIRYDIAKLNHSIVGKFDFIVNNLYVITEENHENGNFQYIMYDNEQHKDIINIFHKYIVEHNFNLEHITFLTGILFLTVVPFYKEQNQKLLLYLTAIKLFNEIF